MSWQKKYISTLLMSIYDSQKCRVGQKLGIPHITLFVVCRKQYRITRKAVHMLDIHYAQTTTKKETVKKFYEKMKLRITMKQPIYTIHSLFHHSHIVFVRGWSQK